MTQPEFAKVMLYLGAGIGKPLSPESLTVYFDCLGDLPYETLLTAAKRALLEHKYATFPSIAELRELATATARGKVVELSSAEAWEIAWRAVGRIDLEVEGKLQRVLKDVPPLVVEAMETYGIPSLCHGKEPVGVVRGQFIKIYEQLAAREKKRALTPPAVKKAIESNKPPAPVLKAIRGIGEMKE